MDRRSISPRSWGRMGTTVRLFPSYSPPALLCAFSGCIIIHLHYATTMCPGDAFHAQQEGSSRPISTEKGQEETRHPPVPPGSLSRPAAKWVQRGGEIMDITHARGGQSKVFPVRQILAGLQKSGRGRALGLVSNASALWDEWEQQFGCFPSRPSSASLLLRSRNPNRVQDLWGCWGRQGEEQQFGCFLTLLLALGMSPRTARLDEGGGRTVRLFPHPSSPRVISSPP